MATKQFGNKPKTPQDTAQAATAELYKLIGANFPCDIAVQDGAIVAFSFDDTWQEGGTTPVETEDGEGNITTEYKENYKTRKLTKQQIAKLEAWAKQNVKG